MLLRLKTLAVRRAPAPAVISVEPEVKETLRGFSGRVGGGGVGAVEDEDEDEDDDLEDEEELPPVSRGHCES
jgi:hypothetical protein